MLAGDKILFATYGRAIFTPSYRMVFLIFFIFKLGLLAGPAHKILTTEREINTYQMISFDVILDTSFQNPFDTQEVSLFMNITTPEKQLIRIAGFYKNDSLWQIRFTPGQAGIYHGRISASVRNDTLDLGEADFSVKESNSAYGFIRINPENDFTFLYDTGKIFRGIGENVCWAHDFEYYFKKLHDAGCNITRIWMCPWNLRFEWSDTGLGHYNLTSAEQLDSILQLAEKYEIYIILVFDYHGVIQKGSGHFNENTWGDNPYNAKNGGPCRESWEFFTSTEAKEFYKKRLRYLVARYAYSPFIHSWEFWNEVDLTTGRPADVINWHCKMSSFLRDIDPYDHLITSSFANPQYPDLWHCTNLDFSQHHIYNARNMPLRIDNYIKEYDLRYNKPHVIGEYGVDFRGARETREVDPDNIGFHNALWAGLLAPTPIIPLTWWWDNLIDPENLYYHFKALSGLWLTTAKDTSMIEQLDVYVNHTNAQYVTQDGTVSKDVTVYPIKKWGKNTTSLFEIDAENGQFNNYDRIPYQLYGSLIPDWRNPPEFIVTYKEAGKFTVHIDRIQGDGELDIFIDDSLIYNKPFLLKPGTGIYEELHWVNGINRYQARINKTFSIDIPAGTHAIRVENGGLDYFEISYYQFENCGIMQKPAIEARAIRIDDRALIWLRNSMYTWKRVALAGLGPTVSNADLILPEFREGDYYIEWWDTEKGITLKKTYQSISGNAALIVKIPPLQKDIACRITFIHPLSPGEIAATAAFMLLLLLTLLWIIRIEKTNSTVHRLKSK